MVEQELNKPERYKKPRTDTIKKSRTSRNKKLAELKLKDLITKQEHSTVPKPSVPKTPKARSILKIHKDRLKTRLIVNTQNSPIYKIAKKISKELTPLIRSGKSYIKDTEQFVDKIRNIKLEEDGTMISFDISDMYPSLPKQDVITEVIRRINDENFKPSMNKKALTELVNISVEFMSFSCNNQYYEQKDGLFIGSSTSPALAELYIQRVEEIHVYKMIHTPRLWLRKVGDTFVITKYDKIETLDELNKFNCKVQFTYESATDNTLLFLDCLIEIDNEESLQTKLYRKKTHTGQYMHYTSNQPEHVKVGTIKTLVRRTKIVCSTEESLTEELNYIKKTMRLNDYPEKLITKTIKRTLLSNSKSKNSQNLETPKLFIPYEKGIAEQLKRVANRYGLELILSRSLSLKSKLPTNPFKSCSTCGVIHKVTYSCYKKYIGETGRTIEERIKEHQPDVNNQKSVEKITGLLKHLRESTHTPIWKEVEIIAKENNIVKRKFKESVAITQERKDNLLNKKEERKVISDIWSTIITQIRVN